MAPESEPNKRFVSQILSHVGRFLGYVFRRIYDHVWCQEAIVHEKREH